MTDGVPVDVLTRVLADPPVTEAVAGIEFRGRGFDVIRLVHEAARWGEDFPIGSVQPALPVTRPVGQPGAEFEMEFFTVPPPRLWNASQDQQWLVQLQDDRLLLNWRKVDAACTYPKYETIRTEFERVLSMLDIPIGQELVPLVAEFSYVNHITHDEASGLHEIYSVFQRPTQPLPGAVVSERYELVTRERTELGFAQLTVTIQPAAGENATTLTVSTKSFAGSQLESSQIMELIDSAHEVSKRAFFAIVSDRATSNWGVQDGS